ncbi:MAG: FAD-dependent oxidoreductase [Burkholderiaceae bacterium]|nr:FAD-dependent oxidoreductase [Roseateles sp.]MBV8470664.1 FAD-dependent oxidoreductase [Burkholderiaceae bacterium]
MPRVAVIGGGWAGLAAAVTAVQADAHPSLFEMAPQLGGRARSLDQGAGRDNGQHILIGAYTEALQLMRELGLAPEQVLRRLPLTLRYPDGAGLTLPPGHPGVAFARAVLAGRRWPWRARWSLLRHATRWQLNGFECDSMLTVAQLCHQMDATVMRDLVSPLCVAALNTPAAQASAQVFLRVLHDALFSGQGSADLLLPRAPLSALLPQPAASWLTAHQVPVHMSTRAQIQRGDSSWRVNGQAFDAIVLATPAREAARLTQALAPDWSALAAAVGFEPIVTVYLRAQATRLPEPMLALREGPQAPAQFIFDLAQLGHPLGGYAMVVSGACRWVEHGLDACAQACLAQVQTQLTWTQPPVLEQVLADKRATFSCVPRLHRPPSRIDERLWAAGDYIEGPYPATLEGAVRSGRHSMRSLLQVLKMQSNFAM